MSFLSDEEDEELDDSFLARWNGRSTIYEDNEDPESSDDEEEDLWAHLALEQQALAQEEERLAQMLQSAARQRRVEAQEMENTRAALEAVRAARRAYQKRYRAGEIPSARAAEFSRKVGERPDSRRRITYKLPRALREALSAYQSQHGIERRQVIIQALRAYLPHAAQGAVTIRAYGARLFMYDEIPSDLWEAIDQACRNADGRRVLHHYEFVEHALTHLFQSTAPSFKDR